MNTYNFLVVLLTFGTIAPTTQPTLSVAEAVDLVWKMNYENINPLHRVVFPKGIREGEDANDPKVIARIEKIKKYNYKRLLRQAAATSVFRTLEAATPEGQELIKTAITGSYAEYDCPATTAEALATMFCFPVGLMAVYASSKKHIEKVDAQRAALQAVPAQVV